LRDLNLEEKKHGEAEDEVHLAQVVLHPYIMAHSCLAVRRGLVCGLHLRHPPVLLRQPCRGKRKKAKQDDSRIGAFAYVLLVVAATMTSTLGFFSSLETSGAEILKVQPDFFGYSTSHTAMDLGTRYKTAGGSFWNSAGTGNPPYPRTNVYREAGVDKNLQERLDELYGEHNERKKNRKDIGFSKVEISEFLIHFHKILFDS